MKLFLTIYLSFFSFMALAMDVKEFKFKPWECDLAQRSYHERSTNHDVDAMLKFEITEEWVGVPPTNGLESVCKVTVATNAGQIKRHYHGNRFNSREEAEANCSWIDGHAKNSPYQQFVLGFSNIRENKKLFSRKKTYDCIYQWITIE